MENLIKNFKHALAIVLASAIMSCEYREFVDNVDYPAQLIYMPAASSATYVIDEPFVDGRPNRHHIDASSNEVVIPLGVYRSGVTNDGSVPVSIAVRNEVISQLISDGTLPDEVEVLPGSQFTLPDNVTVAGGHSSASFNLRVNRDFLRNNDEKWFALSVEVSSNVLDVNEAQANTIVLIDAGLFGE